MDLIPPGEAVNGGDSLFSMRFIQAIEQFLATSIVAFLHAIVLVSITNDCLDRLIPF